MSTAAPQAQLHTQHHRVPIRTAANQARALRLHHMKPGDLFLASPDRNRVLALLSHEQIDVRDAKDLWCVVMHAQPYTGTPPGSLIKLPHEAPVLRVSMLSAPLFQPEE
jgi:hypothetical protein